MVAVAAVVLILPMSGAAAAEQVYSFAATPCKLPKTVIPSSYTIELTGTGSKLDAFLQTIEPGVILETERTGASGIGRGERILRV